MRECHYMKSGCSVHELVEVLISAIEAKDNYTKGHSERVAEMTSDICSHLILSKSEADEIHVAAHLHDLGKIYVEDAVLKKAGKLTEDEWEQIKMHPQVGENILSKVSGFGDIIKMVRHHHERWDGRGYPDGISGENIPLGARIITVADAIDAMLSERPYRPPMTLENCLIELEAGKNKQFDPMIADIAMRILAERV